MLGTSIGLVGQGGTSAGDPYAGYTAAWDMAAAGSYTESGGKVSAWTDQVGSYVLSQGVSADQPALGALTAGPTALLFASTIEWLTSSNAAVVGLANSATATLEVHVTFELDNAATQQAFVIWTNSASNNDFFWIGTDGQGDVRLVRRNLAATNFTVDAAASLTTGVTYVLSLMFGSGVVNGFINGTPIFSDTDYVGTTGALTCDRFNVGARALLSPSLGMQGRVSTVLLK